ncbi:MAG: DUF4358 domain-containing protein [Clostridia bacterium]
MKKIITLILAGVMAFSLMACSNDATTDADVNTDVEVETQVETEVETTPEVEETITIDVAETWTALKETVPEEERVMGGEIDSQMLTDMYGLDETMVSQFVAELPMMSAQIDETLIVEVIDGQVEEVEALILARQEALLSSAFYPELVEFVEDYQMSTQGNYIIFSVGHNAQTYVEAFDALFA